MLPIFLFPQIMGHGNRQMGNTNKILGHINFFCMKFLTFKLLLVTTLWEPENKGNMFVANIFVFMTHNFGLLPKILGTAEIWVSLDCVRDPYFGSSKIWITMQKKKKKKLKIKVSVTHDFGPIPKIMETAELQVTLPIFLWKVP